MAKSYGYGLLDFVNGTLPIAESPRAKGNAWNGVAWEEKKCSVQSEWVSGSRVDGLGTYHH